MTHSKFSSWSRLIGLGMFAVSASAQSLTLTLDSVESSVAFAGEDDSSASYAGLLNFSVNSQSGSARPYPARLSLFSAGFPPNLPLHSTGEFSFAALGGGQSSNEDHSGHDGGNSPFDGIDAERGKNLQILYARQFGAGYNPSALSHTDQSAFQLAVWELAQGDDFGAGDEHTRIIPTGAAAEAQTLVNWVKANATTAPLMDLQILYSSGTSGLLIPTVRFFSPVPEPSTYALCAGLAVISIVTWRRKAS